MRSPLSAPEHRLPPPERRDHAAPPAPSTRATAAWPALFVAAVLTATLGGRWGADAARGLHAPLGALGAILFWVGVLMLLERRRRRDRAVRRVARSPSPRAPHRRPLRYLRRP
ncbi:hypothetical protein [Roseisolibacter sp. H3M3-2]|uniref:hypothetical protein n=1 Tax=Roseisolibacter sp. H3M3-2 TaxID=3031323 RepID=UPI0023D98137|nr:hypothetical protein [Roseisolibacter sp. H3M3-2]MDF1505948.1 hypothetical protein [Roseisolibacter sp. H3M3-2]